MVLTIRDCKTAWEITNGNPAPDFKNLLDLVADVFEKNQYHEDFTNTNYDDSTWNPLKVPEYLNEVIERYKKEGENMVNPSFINIFKDIQKYNCRCKFTPSDPPKRHAITRFTISDYTNFLYLSEFAVKNVNYHFNQIKKGFFRKINIDVFDSNPIILVTNNEKDGLVDVLKKELKDAVSFKHKGIRVLNHGDKENLKPFYSEFSKSDFDFIDIKFTNPAYEFSGILTPEMSVQARFQKDSEPELFGDLNLIKGDILLEISAKCEYGSWPKYFSKLKNS